MRSATNAWAVGDYFSPGPAVYQTLIEQWNGASWSVVPSPSPGTTNNYLNGLLAQVLSVSGIDPAGGFLALNVEQWAQYAAINAFYHKNKPTHGFAVDSVEMINWKPNRPASRIQIGDTFGGLDIALAAMESDADLIRVGFQMTLLGSVKPFVE